MNFVYKLFFPGLRIIMPILFTGIANSCFLMNPAGASFNREPGDSAIRRIEEAAILSDAKRILALSVTSASGSPGQIPVTGLYLYYKYLIPVLSSIDKRKYYLKSEVDSCIDAVASQGLILGTELAVFGECRLEPADGILLGDPLEPF